MKNWQHFFRNLFQAQILTSKVNIFFCKDYTYSIGTTTRTLSKYFRYIGNVELMILFEGKNCPVGRYKYIHITWGSSGATTPSPGVVM